MHWSQIQLMEKNDPCHCSHLFWSWDLVWKNGIFLTNPPNRLPYILDGTYDKYIENHKMLVHLSVGKSATRVCYEKLTLSLNFRNMIYLIVENLKRNNPTTFLTFQYPSESCMTLLHDDLKYLIEVITQKLFLSPSPNFTKIFMEPVKVSISSKSTETWNHPLI
jgi:hypothetical protein